MATMTGKSRSALIAAVFLAASVSVSHAAPCSLAGLAWMAGDWRSTTDPQRGQERWVVGADDVLMGSSWELPNGKRGSAEIMTLRLNGGAVSMYVRHFDGALGNAGEEPNAPM